MAGSARVAVLGAGAMGTALALRTARMGTPTVLLATDRDDTALDAWRHARPHPALHVGFSHIPCLAPVEWRAGRFDAEVILVAVSSGGLARVLSQATAAASPDVWILVTKGWEPGTLRTPSEVAAAATGNGPVVSLAGPALAAEIALGAPAALMLASSDQEARRRAAAVLAGPSTVVYTTSDVVGTETASAFKNVVAIAVGLAEGLSGRLVDGVIEGSFANARAAIFARGVLDMAALVEARGGRLPTVLGLAGVGDLYVTCGQGRNRRFGRLLGDGLTVEAALDEIGSTVEGVANTAAALQLAEGAGLDLPTARIVHQAVGARLTDDRASHDLRAVFTTAFASDIPFVPSLALEGAAR